MPGNETNVLAYLWSRLNLITLQHIGLLTKMEIPYGNNKVQITEEKDIRRYFSDDSHKKADVYLNDIGVSIKQIGGSFAYNRLQREGLINVISSLDIDEPDSLLESFDDEVTKFHKGELESRDRVWASFLSETDFKTILKYFMLVGSASGDSKYPAEYILEAPYNPVDDKDIEVCTFDEYFEKYKDLYRISIRRVWYGQASNSEHSRAKGLMKKSDNLKWVFDDVSGEPGPKPDGEKWRKNIPEKDRKTIYFLMLTKV
jgi:hypothetical protein